MWLAGKGEESDRPDILGVMMDVEDGVVGDHEFGILHLWEIEPGRLYQRRTESIATAVLGQGFLVVFHAPMANGKYWVSFRIPSDTFTEAEAHEIDNIMRRRK